MHQYSIHSASYARVNNQIIWHVWNYQFHEALFIIPIGYRDKSKIPLVIMIKGIYLPGVNNKIPEIAFGENIS
jgi:hypothetical protein